MSNINQQVKQNKETNYLDNEKYLIKNKRYAVISCEIMFREVCYCASQCQNIVDIQFMPKGLHDIGEKNMSEKLQAKIDQVDTEKYDAILLCYGLCNNGVRGLHSKLPLVLPRAHDCITLLLGSKEKYTKCFNDNPGTFFKSPGWIERDSNPNDQEQSITTQLGMNKTYQEYVDKYGEENAAYLMEELGDWLKNYKKIIYIDTKTGDREMYKKIAKQQADDQQWEYDEIDGNTTLIYRLLSGNWNEEDFLIIPPSHKIMPTNKSDIVTYTSL